MGFLEGRNMLHIVFIHFTILKYLLCQGLVWIGCIRIRSLLYGTETVVVSIPVSIQGWTVR